MACCKCSNRTKIIVFFSVGLGLICLSVILIFTWPILYQHILTSQLSLYEGSMSYTMWKESPIPIYLDIYLFNLTNAAEVTKNWKAKPRFEELGPYVFLEKHKRVDIKWNKDDTVTFNQIRTWQFQPDKSKGSLDDNITNLNVIAATVANMVKYKHIVIIKAVDWLMKEEGENLFITHTVQELIFDGYDDKLLKLVQNISIPGFKIPFSRFGWFYGRDGNPDYDGVFTMYTGRNDFNLLGIVNKWNGKESVPSYKGECGKVDGTTGELWPPVKTNQTVKLFASDMCSAVTLAREPWTAEVLGVDGYRFVGNNKSFDSGSLYPENKCFNNVPLPTGLRNVSLCKFGAPAFLSFPHFYLADKSVMNNIEPLKPNKSLHELHLELEPNTGIPLGVQAKIQINIRVEPIPGIGMFKNAKLTYMPMLWFNQRAALTPNLAMMLKLLLILPNLGIYTAYGAIGIGGLLLLIGMLLIPFGKDRGTESQGLITDS